MSTRSIPASIAFIAHSTTQATNALLEGDVAKVGVVTLGGPFARAFARFAPFALAEGVRFTPAWFDGRDARVLDALRDAGVEAVAVSEAFSVDRPQRESALVAAARERGLAATSGAEVSTQYGLRARTRTAALNAAILPRMLRTSRVTARAVTEARIPAPLMIMRSDGGVMDVAEVERRPILTMLSGPAAGIAGALFHENVTDGIFIEVGGTSADCSVIRRGQPQMRPARIGGHRTLLRTLDVRTIAVAGGSLARIAGGRVVDVGPRSAHIAGYQYAAFTDAALVEGARADLASGFAALLAADGTRIAITPTCAANVLGTVPDGAFARGDASAARTACQIVGDALGLSADALASAILDRATERLRATLDELIADYALERANVVLVGGGGGAAALVPYAAQRLGFRAPYRARCRGDLAARRRARARARRRRAHDARPDARRSCPDHGVRRSTPRSPPGPRPTASRSSSKSTRRATACARRRPARPRSSKARSTRSPWTKTHSSPQRLPI